MLTFLPAVDYVVGDNPQALVSGDFNDDSQLDVVVANTGSDNVTLLVGNADGTFTSGGSFAVGDNPTSVAAGDFNNDGKLDLVTANSGSHDLSVLLGNGTGGFGAATSIPYSGPRSVAVGDFNGDGKLDLGVGGSTSEYIPPWGGCGWYYCYGGGGYHLNYSRVSVLLGTGGGSFGNESSYSLGSYISYGGPDVSLEPIAMPDFNADGRADVVTGGGYYTSVFLGNGNGTLASPQVALLSGPTYAIADLNGDGKLDLASYGYSSFVQVALGDGQGAFGNPVTFQAGASPSSVTAADVNVDGRPDLVVVSSQTSDMSVLLGKSGGGLQFTPPLLAATGVSWVAVLSKDFSGDGRPDLAAVDPGSDRMSILLNDGTWPDASAPTLQINDVSVTEGNVGEVNATFTVTLSASYSQDVTFDYATADYFGLNDPATAGVDYVAQSGQITIPAGQTSAVIQVPVIGDRLGERLEHFSVNLSNPSNAFLGDGQGIGTITDDEPVIDFFVAVESLEGNTGTKAMNFVVRLSAASDEGVRVNYSTFEGDTQWTGGGYYGYYPPSPPATAGSDFESTAGTLVFTPGEIEKTISVLVIGDREAEPAEAFSVDLSDAVGARIALGHGVGTILDDEPQAYISTYPYASAPEGNSGQKEMTFTVNLSTAYDLPVTVSYTTTDGSALAGSDYVATSGSVTFNPGETSQSIAVPILGDTVAEYDEYFGVNLTAATNATVFNGTVSGYILDDDTPPTIYIGDAWVTEGNSGTTVMVFTVYLSQPSGQTVQVNYSTANGTAKVSDNDYVRKQGTVVFAPGETSQTIEITVKGDNRREKDERFYVNLSGASGGTIEDSQGVGTILNDDGGGKGHGKGNNRLSSAAAVDAAIHDWLTPTTRKKRGR